jgi:hypothetical protein
MHSIKNQMSVPEASVTGTIRNKSYLRKYSSSLDWRLKILDVLLP